MAGTYNEFRKENRYDQLLYSLQAEKMKELWDNKDDKVWEDL